MLCQKDVFTNIIGFGEKMDVALGSFPAPNRRQNRDEDDEDFSIPATSAMEYLRRVQREAALCPDVVVAEGYSSVDHGIDPLLQVKTSLTPAPKEFIPSYEWQCQLASEFAELRQGLNRFKSSNSSLENSITLPDINSEYDWCQFCLGQHSMDSIKQRRGHRQARANNEIKDQNESETPTTVEKPIENKGTEPLLSVVTKMGQCAVINVLEYHVSWLQMLGFTDRQGKWIYALLACLEKPLLPSVSSLLRNLARRCADLRASLDNKDDERLAALNLIITIITRYFGQTDLADDG